MAKANYKFLNTFSSQLLMQYSIIHSQILCDIPHTVFRSEIDHQGISLPSWDLQLSRGRQNK